MRYSCGRECLELRARELIGMEPLPFLDWISIRLGQPSSSCLVDMKSVLAILGCVDENIPSERVLSSKTVIA